MPTTAQEFMCNIMTASFILPLAKRFAKGGPEVQNNTGNFQQGHQEIRSKHINLETLSHQEVCTIFT
jgi:hypothetical protein